MKMKNWFYNAKPKATTDGKQCEKQPESQKQNIDASTFLPPDQAEVLRYRYHHGTNLGSIFVLERWLTPGMFHAETQGSSELAAVEGWVRHEGVEAARKRFEIHWANYVSDSDLDWLRDGARCTTVRLPVGYFTLGPAFCEHTPFKNVANVYRNAWKAVEGLVDRCYVRGMGVVIDMHALPGGANGNEHSGTNSGKAELWKSSSKRDLAHKCLRFVAEETRNMKGVVGIQIINEAEWDCKGMYDWYDWYDKVVFELSRIDPGMPIYISDAWDLNRAVKWSQGQNNLRNLRLNPIVVDTHLYWCFNEGDQQKSPQQIVDDAQQRLCELDGRDENVVERGAAQVVVGEYSCVLAESSWSRSGGKAREDFIREFGRAQSHRHMQRTGGSFFWTYRMDWMPGGEWGFRQMTEQSAIVPPIWLTLLAEHVHGRIQHERSRKGPMKYRAISAHQAHWASKMPAECEHWRFEQGWDVGFDDALAFFSMRSKSGQHGADKVGMLDLWCLKRLYDCQYNGPSLWEFEHGLRQGIRDFNECVAI